MELRKYLQEDTVAQTGYREPVCVEPRTTIAQAINTMQAENVGCVLVVEGDRLRGIFTERDVLKRVLGRRQSLQDPISTVMTPDPAVARENEPLHLVLARMYAGGRRHLPVVDDAARPVGTISVKRVARLISDHFAPAVYNLPPEHDRFGATREGA